MEAVSEELLPSPGQDGVGELHILAERLAGIIPPANGVGCRNH